MEGRLSQVCALVDSKAKSEQYAALLDALISTGDTHGIDVFLQHVVSDAVPLPLSRQLLSALAAGVPRLPADSQVQAAQSALDTLQPRAASYEGAGTALREALAVALEGRELWAAAARALAAVDLDSGARPQDGDARLARQVRIAQLYLEDDDAGAAEAYVKKAAGLAAATRDAGLELQYRACAARVLDAKRRFLEAGARYYELSHAAAGLAASRASSGPGASEAGASAAGASGAGVSGAGASGAGPSGVGPSSAGPSGGAHPALGTGGIPRPATGMVDEGEVLQALAAAVTCACLAPAGPQRSRLLATLVKDERTLGLPLRGFLEKVHTERLLERSEVEAFEATLAPHQRAVLPDGHTVLGRAIMEHNLQSVSKLYSSVRLDSLAGLLGVGEGVAEASASRMVQEGRLAGRIDQISGLVYFDPAPSASASRDAALLAACQSATELADLLVDRGLCVAGGIA